MTAFGTTDIDRLAALLETAWAQATERRLGLTRSMIARRLFDAAREGINDRERLLASALAVPDDAPFPPDLGMRPLPSTQPIWPVTSLAA